MKSLEMVDEEIKMPLMDGKVAYYISLMTAEELCEILKKEVSFGILTEVVEKLNTDMLRSVGGWIRK